MQARRPTYPLAHSFRQKPRRVPLVLRFTRGSIHGIVFVPVLLHSLFTALIVYLDTYVFKSLGLPSTIIPSLSIVVGLMLVFRNGTSYDRFWTGRNCLTTISTSVRNLARIILVNAKSKESTLGDSALGQAGGRLSDEERRDTEHVLKVLIAVLYAIKHNLRAEFNIPPASLESAPVLDAHSVPVSRRPSYTDRPSYADGQFHDEPEDTAAEEGDGLHQPKDVYKSLLPDGLRGYEDEGLSLPLQLSVLIESYIRRGFDRGWVHAPLASQMTVQINSLVDAYGRMETIRSTPIPVAHLIHQKQVLALFVSVLPFAIVDDYIWWSVPIVAIVAFTLYGIEGIGQQLEDPFGYDKNDIKMDGIIEDTRREVLTLLAEWQKAQGDHEEEGAHLGGMFTCS
ncbi:hypothetical protein BU23DRAFT_583556 [Bimuria novae-zelandiae CBS 107.79]|uniref:Uncharacterized protein n=1 Tax=Bimuria novae-zelandiae CBS 107.79 TaxID=1447943 RepID=A0A6A5URY4_9PLEO|nr:hypothetical protein BU23DRAFT_583556 [Bimuria novae-zelandiae CBS 107.79]